MFVPCVLFVFWFGCGKSNNNLFMCVDEQGYTYMTCHGVWSLASVCDPLRTSSSHRHHRHTTLFATRANGNGSTINPDCTCFSETDPCYRCWMSSAGLDPGGGHGRSPLWRTAPSQNQPVRETRPLSTFFYIFLEHILIGSLYTFFFFFGHVLWKNVYGWRFYDCIYFSFSLFFFRSVYRVCWLDFSPKSSSWSANQLVIFCIPSSDDLTPSY